MANALPSLALHLQLIVLQPKHECVLHALGLIPVLIRHIVETGGAILPTFVHLLAGYYCPRIPSCTDELAVSQVKREDDT